MHQIVEEIIKASRERGFGQVSWPKGEGRDLIASARAMRDRGYNPIIAEIKPKAIGRALTAEEVAAYSRAYANNNACSISVLTEPTYFKGALENVTIARRVKLPVLRKDFIFDERQLGEVQSDLVLLIASLGIDLERFVECAISLGMEPLVEVHTSEELEAALKTDSRIIGINNRNLNTLEVDLGTFEQLAPMALDAGVFLVAESGVHTREDAQRMMDAGADALLIGTALMHEPERLAWLARR